MTTQATRSIEDGLAAFSFRTDSPSASSAKSGRTQTLAAGESKHRSPPSSPRDPVEALNSFIEHLLNPDHSETSPHLVAVGYELEALVSIYGDESVRLSIPSRPSSALPDSAPTLAPPLPIDTSSTSTDTLRDPVLRGSRAWTDAVEDESLGISPMERIRYEVTIPAWEAGDELQGVGQGRVPETPPSLRLLVSLPPTYPNSSPPQLQLLGRYVGSFTIDPALFGDITRTYISSAGVPFTPGDVCVFEGLTHVQNLAKKWYAQNLAADAENERERKEERAKVTAVTPGHQEDGLRPAAVHAQFSYTRRKSEEDETVPQSVKNAEKGLPPGLEIISSEPIVDRKSSFVGHAVRVTDEREVPLVVYELLNDKKIARAAHPTILAYRIAKDVGGAAGTIISADYDDDGETQAGARLQHLLDILELENVLVVVTRWFGGIHLGPDRFKHINQAARDALELGGFLNDDKDAKGKGGKGKGKRR